MKRIGCSLYSRAIVLLVAAAVFVPQLAGGQEVRIPPKREPGKSLEVQPPSRRRSCRPQIAAKSRKHRILDDERSVQHWILRRPRRVRNVEGGIELVRGGLRGSELKLQLLRAFRSGGDEFRCPGSAGAGSCFLCRSFGDRDRRATLERHTAAHSQGTGLIRSHPVTEPRSNRIRKRSTPPG